MYWYVATADLWPLHQKENRNNRKEDDPQQLKVVKKREHSRLPLDDSVNHALCPRDRTRRRRTSCRICRRQAGQHILVSQVHRISMRTQLRGVELCASLESGHGALACSSGMAAIHVALLAALTDRRKSVVSAFL